LNARPKYEAGVLNARQLKFALGINVVHITEEGYDHKHCCYTLLNAL
jgi:hypothetical protein